MHCQCSVPGPDRAETRDGLRKGVGGTRGQLAPGDARGPGAQQQLL